jgi:hypothetical protein
LHLSALFYSAIPRCDFCRKKNIAKTLFLRPITEIGVWIHFFTVFTVEKAGIDQARVKLQAEAG